MDHRLSPLGRIDAGRLRLPSREQHRDIGRVSVLPARPPPGMEAAWQEGAVLARRLMISRVNDGHPASW